MTVDAAPLVVYTDVVDTDITPGLELLHSNGIRTAVASATDTATLLREGAEASALLVGYRRITDEILAGLPKVGLIATQSMGTDMIDHAAAQRHRVEIRNVPGAATEEVATHALAMAIAMIRGLPFLDRTVRAGHWDPTVEELGRPSTMTLSLIGMGRIGRRLGSLALPIFGSIVGYDPHVPDASWPSGVRREPLDRALGLGHVVSLHLPLMPETTNLIDTAALAQMRSGAVLVNVSRGGLIDHSALLNALDSGHLKGAALDVLPEEPPGDNTVTTHPRTLVTPHAAYLSEHSARDYVLIQAQNVVDWLAD